MVLQKYFRDKTVAYRNSRRSKVSRTRMGEVGWFVFEGAVPGEMEGLSFDMSARGVNPQFDAMKILNFASSKESTLEGGRVARLTLWQKNNANAYSCCKSN